VQIELSAEEAAEVRDLLGQVLGDLSQEIADTDNPDYRRGLQARRERLVAVQARLGGA
jgi:hypothetical protein